jgi:predicted O-linked N-acetylglucosamine transferase (SPINDLY family)
MPSIAFNQFSTIQGVGEVMVGRRLRNIWDKLSRNAASPATFSPWSAQAYRDEAERLIATGHLLEDRGLLEEALDRYRAAVALSPDFPRAHMNVGNALRRLERWDEAIAAQRNAVACEPSFARARFNLGFVLAEHGEWLAAERELREALRLDPRMVEPRIALADVYEKEERFDDVERQFRDAIEVDPRHAGVALNIGMFRLRQGDVEEALRWLQTARHLDPTIKGVDSQILFTTNFRADLTPAEIAEAHREIGELLAQTTGPSLDTWPNVIDEDRCLNIGYVSGDFGPHPLAVFIRPILQQHDRARFQVYCYSNLPNVDAVTQTLRESADHWRDISVLTDAQVIDQLRKDGIDILVDLSGHTNRERLSIFARHPAPVQVTWLGYLNTTGLAAMDYRITDAHTDPVGMTEGLHTEQLVRMPNSQWCYFAWHDIAEIPIPHVERPDALVFGSFNQYSKITKATLALWARVLNQVPAAELVVLDVRQERSRALLRDRLGNVGLDVNRVRLHGRMPIREYFAAIGNVDIALDTMPYNGATTTLDTLWMGVPLVAFSGDRGIARGSYSILKTLGEEELIATTHDEYVDINVCLACDRRWRERLRATLRQRLAASPLMDAHGFTRGLEARYRDMWRRWCVKVSSSTTSSEDQ